MIGVWKRRNEQCREQAQMRASMMGLPLELGEMPDIPSYKSVPEHLRVRRFQLGKLTLMMKDRDEEMAAIRKRTIAEEQDIQAQVEVVDNATRLLTADALSTLPNESLKREGDADETGTIMEGLSPKQLDEVDPWEMDTLAKEPHDAALAAALSTDAQSSESPSAAAQSKKPIPSRVKGNKVKPAAKPMTWIEEQSETGSYGTAEDAEEEKEVLADADPEADAVEAEVKDATKTDEVRD
eukprot:2223684-Amphidinium_carterae.2